MAKRISVAAAKAKGRKFQQQIAKDVSSLINIPCGKDELVESREMGQSGCDLKLIGEARKLFPWSVEAKNDKSFQLKSWIRQASSNIMDDTNWIVFFKKNNFKPVAVLDYNLLSDLFNDTALTLYEYSTKSWFLNKWIDKARSQSKEQSWLIKMKQGEKTIGMMEMKQFFHLLSVHHSGVKGSYKRY